MTKLILPVLMAGILSACAGQPKTPPVIAYDSSDFQAAAVEPEPPLPVQIVEKPVPLPLPGQLQPLPSVPTVVAPDNRLPTQRIADANKAATLEPTRSGYLNAMQVYPYTEGALYRLYAAPERVTDIALQPGEALVAVSTGDTVRWIIGDTSSGAGEASRVHVLVKPVAASLTTNLVITTDRRAYHLLLESTPQTAMASLSWTYPQDQLLALQRRNSQAATAQPVASGLSLENLHFRYAITGENPAWRPQRVFDDGDKVYIEFPDRLDQGEAPPLFVIGAQGEAQLVNYRVRGRHYIVDRLFAAAELRLGGEPQQVVRIERTDGRPS
ncbi:P-type conjugative transfer protein TrbG [Niveispirillum sp. KHB5.9]|uniref:P-type conjugative transfer protein TrbG n=1 Tax=Niveispirillum sp. KHB5.9 TaxID=3400269 RepID=UPI003A837BAC